MRVLIACEESQRVCIAFRERGHEAYKNGKAKVWEDTAVNGGIARSKTFHGIAKAMAEQWG